jgi:hypothetical protein
VKRLKAAAHDFAGFLRREFAREIGRRSCRFQKASRETDSSRATAQAGSSERSPPRFRRLHGEARKVGKGCTPIPDPNFDELDTYSRYLAEKGLHAAIARRRRMIARLGNPSQRTG